MSRFESQEVPEPEEEVIFEHYCPDCDRYISIDPREPECPYCGKLL